MNFPAEAVAVPLRGPPRLEPLNLAGGFRCYPRQKYGPGRSILFEPNPHPPKAPARSHPAKRGGAAVGRGLATVVCQGKKNAGRPAAGLTRRNGLGRQRVQLAHARTAPGSAVYGGSIFEQGKNPRCLHRAAGAQPGYWRGNVSARRPQAPGPTHQPLSGGGQGPAAYCHGRRVGP